QTAIKGVTVTGDANKFESPNDATKDVLVTRQSNGAEVIFPAILQKGEVWNVRTLFRATPGENATYTMNVNVIDTNDQVIQNGTVTATASTEYKAYRYNNPPVFPAVPFNSAPITRDVEIENLTNVPIVVTDPPVPVFGGNSTHPQSFSVVSPAANQWPITLGPNEKKIITIQFDPSVSSDPVQNVHLVPKSTACEDVPFTATAEISVGGITAGAYPTQEAFSCATTVVNVPVTGDPDITPGPLTWTIVGQNPGNFATAIASGVTIDRNQVIDVPVIFTPTAGTAGQTYAATIEFSYTNSQNETTTRSVALNGVSGGIVAKATSTFATVNAEAGDVVRLPITLDIQKNVQSLDLSTANLQTVHLVYTYNTDLLSFGDRNIANSVFNLPQGWSVDGARSTQGTNRLDLWLTGTRSLTDNDRSLGEIEFFVRLPEKDQTDDVRLESFELTGANGETFGQCLSTSTEGTQLNLVYRCGDAVYRQIMENGRLGTIVEPLRPNPITDEKVVTFRYATRVETPITLEIVDALGNVVDRVVDNLFHQVGAYQVNYDVSKLQSGSYVYRLTSSGTKTSSRFVVTK
ncbi:MAG TPA: T9SS type A sorting domain-containing protein, partial [Candidatus Kapabacteria bacterium]|nr:T9SS type A sorting domain-containing protein [Candidatus Kapabacteria bacterium]